ncbi:unnamed protein product [Phyllotreta striolata]|uniref:Cytochrome P450 n=1 Tax=Phyllotreta striolata TaxID=444603 RepID=A0A9N9XPI6_PHYSR|nr:unnamed protein product [Phyllotreta striolata]
MFIVITLLTIIIALFYYICVKPMYYWKNQGVKQTPIVWILGDNWRNVFKMESLSEMVKRTYDFAPGTRYSAMCQFITPQLIIKDPELIKLITIKHFDHFVDHKTFVTERADPLFGKNLFSLTGQRWRDMRPILSPSFTSSKMKSMFVLMADCAKSFTNFFLQKNQDVVEVEMKDVFSRYTNDVIASTAFGIEVNSLKEPNNDFYRMGKKATSFDSLGQRLKFFALLLCPEILYYLNIGFFDKEISQFFMDLVSNNIKVRKEKGITRPDVLQLLMDAQKPEDEINGENIDSKTGKLSITDIVAQALIFFFAGFDGVSSSMCFMAYELAVNVDVQSKLREEINETLDKYDGKPTYDGILKMQYLDMVVSEVLRKWPIGQGTDRVCTIPYTIEPVRADEKPITVKEGDTLWLPIFGIHRDPEIYPDPDRFDPERFNDENKAKIDPYLYMPFGFGPRSCIGNRFALQEMKIVFFYLLANFEIIPIAKTVIPIQLSKGTLNATAEGGFPLGLKRIVK